MRSRIHVCCGLHIVLARYVYFELCGAAEFVALLERFSFEECAREQVLLGERTVALANRLLFAFCRSGNGNELSSSAIVVASSSVASFLV